MYRSIHAQAYSDSQITSDVKEKSGDELISLLFEKASVLMSRLETLSRRKDVDKEAISEAINRVIRIVLGLRDVLDMEKGGTVSEALYLAYSSIATNLFKQIRRVDPQEISKLKQAIEEIRSAWTTVVSLPK